MKYKNFVFDLYGTLVDVFTEEDSSTFEDGGIFYRARSDLYAGAV